MPKTIRAKLFLTFLVTTLLIVSGMYFFMRWSLDRGFAEFIETRQKEHVESLIEDLAEYYANNQTWQALADDKQKWIDLLWQSNPHRHQRPPIWLKQAHKTPNGIWPPTFSKLPATKRFLPLELRAMLLDADKAMIFGRLDALEELTLHPIHYQERIVGFLGLLPGKPVNQVSETRFMERQSESFIWIAALMVFLSAGLAWLLAYTLGLPLKRITKSAKALAVGRYDIRLPVESNDELGQLARDFNEMATALEQSEQARRRWVADISHELRTPLAVLRGELEALQDGIRPMTASAVDSLFSDVMRLNRLTEDLYQLSLSDQGALSYRKAHINPVEILKEDLLALKPEFQNKQITIDFINGLDRAINIYADPDRLSQLFRNLLHNSASYTDNNGKLSISIFRESDNLVIIFSDSGPGVPEHELPKLFDRFYRVESSRNRNHGGAGLGLAICSNIVEAHHGTIKAQPSPLNGIAIRIELPISS